MLLYVTIFEDEESASRKKIVKTVDVYINSHAKGKSLSINIRINSDFATA